LVTVMGGRAWHSILLSTAIDLVSPNNLDFLEIKSLDQCEELVLGLLKLVVHKTVGEQDGVVGQLNLCDGFLHSNFEFLFSLDSVSDTLSQLFNRRWVDEQEVSFQCLLVHLHSTLYINLNDWNLVVSLNSLKLTVGCTVPAALSSLSVFNKSFLVNHSLKLL